MEAFPYQYQQNNVDSMHNVQIPPMKIHGLMEVPTAIISNTNCFPQIYTPESFQQVSTNPKVYVGSNKVSPINNEPTGRNKTCTDCSSVTDKFESGEQVTQKRKPKEGFCVDLSPSQDMGDKMKWKRQRRSNGVMKKVEDKKKKEDKKVEDGKKKEDKKDEKKGSGEASTGYIHVRARRGQATDSHSLAERVRREKISERMKILQALVPGCDKVTGKALMLDEIINYVQSLQNQVEFLSMKLASLNPMLSDFGMDLDSFMERPDLTLSSFGPPVQNIEQWDQMQPPGLCHNNSILANASNSSQEDGLAFMFLQQTQMAQFLAQAKGQLLWDVDGQRQMFGNKQPGFNSNFSSFH